MKLKALVADREEDLLFKLEAGQISAEIGGRVYAIQVRDLQADSYLYEFRSDYFLLAIDSNCR